MYRLEGTPVPAGVHESGRLKYTMSWELYRALQGKEYTYSDKVLDETWVSQQKREVLWWDKRGMGHVALMDRKAADAFEENRRKMREQRFKDEAWATYRWLQEEASFERDLQDALYKLRKTLEAME